MTKKQESAIRKYVQEAGLANGVKLTQSKMLILESRGGANGEPKTYAYIEYGKGDFYQVLTGHDGEVHFNLIDFKAVADEESSQLDSAPTEAPTETPEETAACDFVFKVLASNGVLVERAGMKVLDATYHDDGRICMAVVETANGEQCDVVQWDDLSTGCRLLFPDGTKFLLSKPAEKSSQLDSAPHRGPHRG